MSAYSNLGFENREAYLLSLSNEYKVKPEAVFALASMLGPLEDFDGLVTVLRTAYLRKIACAAKLSTRYK